MTTYNLRKNSGAERLLRESERRLNIALENANIGLWEWDFGKNELIWDERSERMFGLTPGTFGKTLEAFEDLAWRQNLGRIHPVKGSNFLIHYPKLVFAKIYRRKS